MGTIEVIGIGPFPSIKAEELKIGDKVIFNLREMGEITNLQNCDEYVRITLRDSCSHTDFSVSRRKSAQVGVLPPR